MVAAQPAIRTPHPLNSPAMQPTMFVLIGMPAVGKYTVAKELADLTGARLVDNHSIANLIFNVIAVDGVTPLPPRTFSHVGRVRAVVMDMIAEVAPPELSYVFTVVLVGNEPPEQAIFDRMLEVAEQRGSLFVPVLLRCRTEEVVQRAANESRVRMMKLIDPIAIADLNENRAQFETDHPNTIRLDTSETPAAETARKILAWAESRGAS